MTILFLDSKSEVAKGTSEDFYFNITPPLTLENEQKYEIALLNASVWYSWFNITTTNQNFRYYNGRKWKLIQVPVGAYNIEDINQHIQKTIRRVEGEDAGENIKIIPNYNTLHSEIELKGNYKVDFNIPHSLRSVLGFDSKIINKTTTGNTLVNITTVSSILIHCDLVSSSYINGHMGDAIYSFNPNVPPGYLLNVQPNEAKYLPINRTNIIDRINIRITDQTGNNLDLNNESVTITLDLRERK